MSLRTRLLLLVLVPVVPALVLALWTSLHQRKVEAQRVEQDAARVVELAAAGQRALLDATRQHLEALAHLPQARGTNIAAFDVFFSNIPKIYTDYTDFGLLETNGELISSSFARSLAGPAADQGRLLDRVRQTRTFVVGRSSRTDGSRKAGLVCGHPVFDENGRLMRILYATLDRAAMERAARRAQLPAGGLCLVLDNAGRVLTAQPDPGRWGGSNLVNSVFGRALLERGTGTMRTRDPDGVARLTAFTAVQGARDPQLFVSVGVPTSFAYAPVRWMLIRNLLILGAVALLAMAAAWYYASVQIIRPVRDMVDVTRRLAGGDLTVRTKPSGVAAEFRELEIAFDDMAEALARQRRETDASQSALRDLTASLERRVQERTMQLEEANKELESFSYSVSHDLRAPLRHIAGFLNLLTRDDGTTLSDSGRRYTGIISDAARRMGALIDDLLDFSRTGRKDLVRIEVDMRALVDEVLHDLANDLAGRSVEWVIGDLPRVSSDRSLLKQVWFNLLSNAVKYSRNRETARVEVQCRQEGSNFEFRVSDNGAGFDPRFAGKLFGVFQRLHRQEEFDGTGIGLANVRRIVTRHGGRVWAEGRINEGAAFYFSLPTAPA